MSTSAQCSGKQLHRMPNAHRVSVLNQRDLLREWFSCADCSRRVSYVLSPKVHWSGRARTMKSRRKAGQHQHCRPDQFGTRTSQRSSSSSSRSGFHELDDDLDVIRLSCERSLEFGRRLTPRDEALQPRAVHACQHLRRFVPMALVRVDAPDQRCCGGRRWRPRRPPGDSWCARRSRHLEAHNAPTSHRSGLSRR